MIVDWNQCPSIRNRPSSLCLNRAAEKPPLVRRGGWSLGRALVRRSGTVERRSNPDTSPTRPHAERGGGTSCVKQGEQAGESSPNWPPENRGSVSMSCDPADGA